MAHRIPRFETCHSDDDLGTKGEVMRNPLKRMHLYGFLMDNEVVVLVDTSA